MRVKKFITDYLVSFALPPESEHRIETLNPETSITKLNGPFSFGIALGSYSVGKFHDKTDMGTLIHLMKYHQNLEAANKLGDFIISQLDKIRLPNSPDILITIPDSVINRPFSSVHYLAEYIGQNYHWPVSHDIFSRARLVKPQKGRTYEERVADEELRYVLNKPELVKNKHVLLFDDIFATGRSLSEAASHIWEHSPRSIMALTLVNLKFPEESEDS